MKYNSFFILLFIIFSCKEEETLYDCLGKCPIIKSISPQSSFVGDSITIIGEKFTKVTSVFFKEGNEEPTELIPRIISDEKLIVMIPNKKINTTDSVLVYVTLNERNILFSSQDLIYFHYKKSEIDTFYPMSGRIDTIITIEGKFDNSSIESVKINGVALDVLNPNQKNILKVRLSKTTGTGKIKISLKDNSEITSQNLFTYQFLYKLDENPLSLPSGMSLNSNASITFLANGNLVYSNYVSNRKIEYIEISPDNPSLLIKKIADEKDNLDTSFRNPISIGSNGNDIIALVRPTFWDYQLKNITKGIIPGPKQSFYSAFVTPIDMDCRNNEYFIGTTRHDSNYKNTGLYEVKNSTYNNIIKFATPEEVCATRNGVYYIDAEFSSPGSSIYKLRHYTGLILQTLYDNGSSKISNLTNNKIVEDDFVYFLTGNILNVVNVLDFKLVQYNLGLQGYRYNNNMVISKDNEIYIVLEKSNNYGIYKIRKI